MLLKLIQAGKILSLVSIFTFIVLSFAVSPTYATGSVLITLSPTSGSIGKTEQSISVNLDTASTAIASVNLNVTYDPAVLSVTVQEGTITELSQLFSSSVTNGIINIQAGALSYSGSGLLATLKFKTLDAITTVQSTEITIKADSKVTSPTDASTNQLASSVLGATSTFSADPNYTSSLPTTAIFDDNRAVLIFQVLIGITLVYLGVRAIRNKTKNQDIV